MAEWSRNELIMRALEIRVANVRLVSIAMAREFCKVVLGGMVKLVLCSMMLLPTLCFADTVSYTCHYPIFTTREGLHKSKEKFELKFLVDKTAGKAYILGNQGSTEVKMFDFGEQIAFLEITGLGNLMSTAIDGKRKSVHSRNTVIFGELSASQYFGDCEVR